MPIDYRKYKRFCLECPWRGLQGDLLRATNPFDESDSISGCPRCHSIDSAVPACDEEGCWEPVTCGTPIEEDEDTGKKYRNTCSKHRPKEAAEAAGEKPYSEDEHIDCDHPGGDCIHKREEGLRPLLALRQHPPRPVSEKEDHDVD